MASVRVIACGGTIASHFDGVDWQQVPGRRLVDELGVLLGADGVPVQAQVDDVAAGPSSNLGVDEMLDIARQAVAAARHGEPVVVVHGTDTVELTAYLADLLLGADRSAAPVVFTGSMRVHSHPAPDGPGNLRHAVRVATSPAARGRGVLLCFDSRVHAADRVVKCNANSLDAFTSAPGAAVGTVDGDAVRFSEPARLRQLAATGFDTAVGLLAVYPGMSAEELQRALHGRRGLVLEVFGDLNVPRHLWEGIHHARRDGVLVVLASRAFTSTSTSADLELLGAVGAGGLTAQKARLAAMAALGSTDDRDAAAAWLAARALTYDPGERSSA